MVVDLSVFDKIKTVKDYQDAEQEFQLKKLAAMKSAQGNDPAALQLANAYLEAKQSGNIDKANALEMFGKTLAEKGMLQNADGSYGYAQGVIPSAAAMAGAKESAKEQASQIQKDIHEPQRAGDVKKAELGQQLSYSGPIERAKKEGQGEITDIAKANTGKGQVSSAVQDVRDYYEELKNKNAAISTQQSGLENAINRTRSSGVGQFLGKTFGTEEQSIRNKINNQKPALINAIRQATGMSAKAMDSNVELQFYLQQATDPSLDIESNLSALDSIEKKYGISTSIPDQITLPPEIGLPSTALPQLPPDVSLPGAREFYDKKKPLLKYNPQTGEFE
jgi:hypothetical protein